MEKLEKLEKLFGKKYPEWDVDDIQKMLIDSDTEKLNLFKDNEVIEFLYKNSKNDKVDSIIESVYLDSKLRNSLGKVENICKKYLEGVPENKVTEEIQKNLINDLKKNLDDSVDPIDKFVAYYSVLISQRSNITAPKGTKLNITYPINLKENAEDLKKNLADIRKIICNLKDIEGAFIPINKILNIFFSIRELYFEEFNIDVESEKDPKFEEVLDRIDKYATEIEKLNKSLEEEQKKCDCGDSECHCDDKGCDCHKHDSEEEK